MSQKLVIIGASMASGRVLEGVFEQAPIAAIMYGDTADGAWFFGQMNEGDDIAHNRGALIFGAAYARSAPTDISTRAV